MALRQSPRKSASAIQALRTVFSAESPAELTPEDLSRQRLGQEVLGRLVSPMRGMDWIPFEIGSMPAAWVRPKRAHPANRVILYCHGGGYTSGNLGYSRPLAAKLAQATGCEVLSFEYRLAPEHPYPAAAEDALCAWDYLMHSGVGAREVMVMGDSAGGNLALTLTLRLLAAGRRGPRALILLSPWTDMTLSGKSYMENIAIDPVLTMRYITATRRAYAPDGGDYADPLLSPLFGDFTGFPPVLIQTGEQELLLSDSVRLRDRLIDAGILCRLEVWREMWHVFQLFPIPQAARAVDHIARFAFELWE